MDKPKISEDRLHAAGVLLASHEALCRALLEAHLNTLAIIAQLLDSNSSTEMPPEQLDS